MVGRRFLDGFRRVALATGLLFAFIPTALALGQQPRLAGALSPLRITARGEARIVGPGLGVWSLNAVSMATPEVGWAASDGPPLAALETTDGGRTFVRRYSPAEPIVALSTPDAAHAYFLENACGGTGCLSATLVATADGGRSFRILWTRSGFSAAAVSFPDARDGYIAGAPRPPSGPPPTTGTLYVTHDGGVTWTALRLPCASPTPDSMALDFTSVDEGWLLCGGQGATGQQLKSLLQTTDGGRTWTTVARTGDASHPNSLPSGGHVHALFFGSPTTGYIGLDRGGFFASHDGGKTWAPTFTSVVPPGSDLALAVGFLPGGFGWLLSSELLTTADGGKSWRQVYPPTVPAVVGDLPGGEAVGVASVFGQPAVVASTDGGQSWTAIGRLPWWPTAFQVLSPDVLMASYGASIALSQDGGRRWSQVPLPRGWFATDLGFVGPGLGWVVAEGPRPSESALFACAGATCHRVPTPFTPVAALLTDPSSGLAVGATTTRRAALFTTADGGRHWSTRFLPQGFEPIGLGVTPELWWIYAAHTLLLSVDRGATWREVRLPFGGTITSLSFQDWTHGLLTTADALGRNALWETSDGGQTFEVVRPTLHSIRP